MSRGVPDLSGKVAVVTGAASPIGTAIAQLFTECGAKLVLGDLDAAGLDALAKTLPAGTQTLGGNLAKDETAEALIGLAKAQFGRLDILVNNAGGGIIRPFLDHTPDTLRETVDRNLWTCVWCCRHALPIMVAQRAGRIINIGADSVRNGLWAHAGYNAAKGGMHGLTTGLAREFAEHDITVNTVAPCMVRTPLVEREAEAGNPMFEKFLSVIPKGRTGEPAEIASMVAYLASDAAAFVTGQVISVNGGSTML
jgi:2,3-dihydroxy-2,3-dihydro-p-cumate dehydrogenase